MNMPLPLSMLRAVAASVLCIVALSAARGSDPKPAPPKNLAAVEQRALAMMKDIAPRRPGPKQPASLSSGKDFTCWGKLFADDQIAALVAVDLAKHVKYRQDEADLCLLLWDKGWHFQQWVGKVYAKDDDNENIPWIINYDPNGNACYVLTNLSLYPEEKHLSWLCDAKTHTLQPTGWSANSLPSIFGKTITFTSQDKPGYTPTKRDIRQFPDGVVGKQIATIAEENLDHPPKVAVSAWDNDLGKFVIWHIWKKDKNHYDPHHDIYSLSVDAPGAADAATGGEITIEFDWGDDYGDYSAAIYIFHQLTGLSSHEFFGEWSEDVYREIKMPLAAKITGSPVAAHRFTWPENAGAPQP
ncbi:MAG TPA: hypothetical protein VG733_18500 [Chthoniobacteraceae bacterium]|nr:hypothetical protein [Chthoniobacteraceae bacterium]